MPLEGLEHVLSIVLCDPKRQIPRNYAAFRDSDDIDPRPKTAISKQDAGKKRAKIGPFCRSISDIWRGPSFIGIQQQTPKCQF